MINAQQKGDPIGRLFIALYLPLCVLLFLVHRGKRIVILKMYKS